MGSAGSGWRHLPRLLLLQSRVAHPPRFAAICRRLGVSRGTGLRCAAVVGGPSVRATTGAEADCDNGSNQRRMSPSDDRSCQSEHVSFSSVVARRDAHRANLPQLRARRHDRRKCDAQHVAALELHRTGHQRFFDALTRFLGLVFMACTGPFLLLSRNETTRIHFLDRRGHGRPRRAGVGAAPPPAAHGRHASHYTMFLKDPASVDMRRDMVETGTTLVAWAIVDDVSWIRLGPQGVKQVQVPAPGELWTTSRRGPSATTLSCAAGTSQGATPADVDAALDGKPHVVMASESANFLKAVPSGLRRRTPWRGTCSSSTTSNRRWATCRPKARSTTACHRWRFE
jgi:hypothetical protein